MKIKSQLFLGLFILLHFSCGRSFTFSHNLDIPETGWAYENILKYDFEVADTDALYDLYLEIDYKTSFSFQNMYVNVYTGQEESEMKKALLSLDLSNNLGIWKGDCNAEKCTYLLPLQKSIYFEQAGGQKFWLEQFSRSPILKGVQSIKLVGDIVGSKKGK